MSVVANAHWSHKWVTPREVKTNQKREIKREREREKERKGDVSKAGEVGGWRLNAHVLKKLTPCVINLLRSDLCLQIPCVTTGCAGLEGWKVEPEITPGSPLGLGGVTLGEVVPAGFELMASCCLVDWGNFEQHLEQVDFRQANGWETYWDKWHDV